MDIKPKHIVIDGRIRRASTGRPVARFIERLPELDKTNTYTILVEPTDELAIKTDNIAVLPCPYAQFSFNIFRQLSFSRFIKKLNPDLVFFTLTAQAPLFFRHINITLTHDLTMFKYARAGRLPGWLHALRMVGYRLLFWSGNKFASQIIVPTNYVKTDLVNYSKKLENKIQVVYEAGDMPSSVKPTSLKFKSQSTAQQKNSKFILHVGSPFPHKNIENLVLAHQQLIKTNPGLNLVLAGKKEYYFNNLEKWLAGQNNKDRVIIPGFVSDGELKWLYENAECYVLPSLSEGFGLPGLEAMAHNCPLVSSNATCLPEVYGNGATYFEPNSVDDMTKAIDEVINSKELKNKLIKNGQSQLKKYSWDKMSQEIIEIIKNNL